MTKKLKRPCSLLLVVMMVVGLFTAIPMTASAEEIYNSEIDATQLQAGDILCKDTVISCNNYASLDITYTAIDGTETYGYISQNQTITMPKSYIVTGKEPDPDEDHVDFWLLYLEEYAVHTVTWKNWDGNVLETDENVEMSSISLILKKITSIYCTRPINVTAQ